MEIKPANQLLRLGILVFAPLLLFSLLTLANWLGWRHENGLIRQMMATQSRNIAQELRWRFKQQLGERLADLAGLGFLWRTLPEHQRERRFVQVAGHQIEIEPSYHVINHVSEHSVITLSVPRQRRPELEGLDLKTLAGRARLHQQVQKNVQPLASPPITLTTDRPGLVIWYPLAKGKDAAAFDGQMIAGTFHLAVILDRILSDFQYQGFAVAICFESEKIRKAEQPVLDSGATSRLRILGRDWAFSVFPLKQSPFARLLQKSRNRFAVNLALFVLASVLLFLAILAFYRIIDSRQRIRRSEKKYLSLFEHAGDPVFVLDLDGGFLEVNRFACDRLGYSREELLAMNIRQIIAPSQLGHAGERLRQARRQKGYSFESIHVSRDGVHMPVEVSLSVADYDHSPVCIAIVRDLSERKQMEMALGRAQQEWKSIFHAIGHPTLILSPQHRILAANQAALQVTGMTEEALKGKSCYQVFHHSPHPPACCPLETLLETGRLETRIMEVEILEGTFLISCTPMWDAQGDIEKIIHIATDITEQKKDQAQKEKLERQLRQSQKMEAIGTLAGGVAHDFNNILAGIMGYAELSLINLGAGDPVRYHLKNLLKAVFRAKELVSQILTFSRHSEKTQRLLALGPIIKESVKFMRSSLPATIEIRHALNADTDIILGDPTQIHQLLINLCTNAGHAMRKQGGVLSLELSQTELAEPPAPGLSPGAYLKLTVFDTGQGMDPHTLERIFEPYFTTKKQGEGTGLGLAVVHGIVKSHGGEIKVYSEPGKGTRVTVFLPRIREKMEPAAPVDTEPLPTGTESILFVDDEAVLTEIAKQLLQSLGYQVTVMSSPVEALERIRNHPEGFDLLITDQTMPKMTGVELALAVMDLQPDLPVILSSGFGDIVQGRSLDSLNIALFLMKPFDIRQLARTVRLALDRPRPQP